MNETHCDQFTDALVDYADGELPGADGAKLEDHLASCQSCRRTVEALRKSIDLVRVVWADADTQSGRASSRPTAAAAPVRRHMPARRSRILPALRLPIAAGILLIVTASIARHYLSPRNTQSIVAQATPNLPGPATSTTLRDDRSRPPGNLTAEQIERTITRAGLAAQLLAAADLLAAAPEGEQIARQRYEYIAKQYAQSRAAADAAARLQTVAKGAAQ